jgi:hypothetical protein
MEGTGVGASTAALGGVGGCRSRSLRSLDRERRRSSLLSSLLSSLRLSSRYLSSLYRSLSLSLLSLSLSRSLSSSCLDLLLGLCAVRRVGEGDLGEER